MHMHTHDGWFPELVLLYSEAGQATTFHVDCEPWWQPNAVLIGDAAHAYGPLTAKMANLAMNDAHSLATMLNGPNVYDLSQEQILKKWQSVQRPKFEVTRIRTLRHLQLYTPTVRAIVKFLWKFCPQFTSRYFQSIFSYDYDIMTRKDTPNMTWVLLASKMLTRWSHIPRSVFMMFYITSEWQFLFSSYSLVSIRNEFPFLLVFVSLIV